ncbi:succinate dehydrogenase assembly factor 2 [Ehrlichia chaffeensis]|nr:succinate dehydrogenase assembly factor 2 [Ehrlichia chaffeensis]
MDELLVKRKRLLYRSLHRGCKEMDIILGNFALHCIHLLSSKDVDEYEKIVNTSDYQLYKYITGEELIPQYLDNNIMKDIIRINESLIKSKFAD